jgi:secreted trypsin-like serine protease
MIRVSRLHWRGSVAWAFGGLLVLGGVAGCPSTDTTKPPVEATVRPTTSDSPVSGTTTPVHGGPATPPTTATATPPEVVCNAVGTRADSRRDMTRRENKIVGGRPSKEGDFPFAVALAAGSGTQLRQYCGGALVEKDWVLTAAHCQVAVGEKAIIGRRDLSKSDGKVIEVKRVLNHGAYDPETNDNDIALLELAEPAEGEAVAPYVGSSALGGETSVVVGWGRLTEGGGASSVLQEVSVPVVSNETCSSGYASDGVAITGNMLCAGLATGGKDSCQGDSGGPLLVNQGGKLQQAGIVSFGIGCARPNRYGVYTRVANYAGWIQACLKKP